MVFLGYHGTSETSARNILAVGIKEEFLPETGQIGRGFYIAKMNGTLPQWGAEQATAPERSNLSWFQKVVTYLTGEQQNPFLGNNAKRTILKIYAKRNLVHCKWSIMNPTDIHTMNVFLQQGSTSAGMIADWTKWLQMVVPPEELPYLVAMRDDGINEPTQNWHAKESPF